LRAMPPQRSPQEIKAMKAKFDRADISKDGTIDEKEMGSMLKKGNPKITDSEIRCLFRDADKNGDRRISFDEFVDYLFGAKEKEAAMDKAATPEIRAVFDNFAKDGTLDARQFQKLCSDCCLTNTGTFKPSDCGLVFSKVKKLKAEKTIGLTEFMEAVEVIAQKRGCDVLEVHRALEITGAPLAAEQTQPNLEKRLTRKSAAYAAYEADMPKVPREALSQADLKTKNILDVFLVFAYSSGDMDSRLFGKCMKECGVQGKDFGASDSERVFAATCTRADRKIAFAEFQQALAAVAGKKSCSVAEIEDAVAACKPYST